MRSILYLCLLLAISHCLWAQSNYVVRSANSALPPGSFNTIVGPSAGNTTMTGSYNAFLGYQAGTSTTSGLSNTFLGYLAGPFNSSGDYNVFNGYEAGYTNSVGSQNTFIGSYAGYNSTASDNTFIGYQAGQSNTSGQSNTFIGHQAGWTVTTGSNNIIIGPSSGTAIIDGNDNVLMGYNAQAEDGLHNATAIGANTRVASSNAVVLGNQANVGIGTSTPTARLEVDSGVNDESGLRLSRLTANSPAQWPIAEKVLTVDATGKLVLAQAGQYSIRSVADWSDKVFAADYKLLSLAEVERHIQQSGHLPNVPSAAEVVKYGIDAAKMDARLLEKIEELTLYSIQLEKANRQQAQELQAIKQKQAELEQMLKEVLKRN